MLRGRITLPVLEAFNEDKFQLVIGQPLIEELHQVWNQPRLRQRLDPDQAVRLEQQLSERWREKVSAISFDEEAESAFLIVFEFVLAEMVSALDRFQFLKGIYPVDGE